jgi:DNA-binding Lrp family transcriptional regulator
MWESNGRNRRRHGEIMKDVELRLISELMKNCRKSDRDLAKAVGVSQPTVTRIRSRLEKEGIIKEYTMIPDFSKLGFEIAAVTFTRFTKELSSEELDELRRYSRQMEKKKSEAVLMAMNGMGLGYNRVFISFHKNYGSYVKAMNEVKTIPNVDPSHVESFMMSLVDGSHFQPLTFSVIANYLLETKEEKL